MRHVVPHDVPLARDIAIFVVEQYIRVFEAAMMMSYSAPCVNGRAASSIGSHLPSLTASLERR